MELSFPTIGRAGRLKRVISIVSLFGLSLSALGAAGAHFRFLSPILGFYLCLAGLALMVLIFFPAIFSLFRRGPTSWLGILLGLGSIGLVGFAIKLAVESPLNDLTTDLQNPPKLTAVSYTLSAPGLEDLLDTSFYVDKSYDPGQGARQVTHWPSLSSLPVKASAGKTYPLLEKVILEQFPDWKIVKRSPESHRMEIEVESKLFRFIDDIAIELRSAKDSADSTIEFRSRSRFGKSDLGANARRIEDLKVRFNIAIVAAEALDAPRREAVALAEKAEAERKQKEQEAALEAGRQITAPVVRPETIHGPKGPPPAALSPYEERIGAPASN